MSEAKINVLVKTRDGLRMAADAIDEFLETLGPRPKTGSDQSGDMSEIIWRPETGPHGNFEKSEDRENPRFQALLKTLQAHNGKMMLDGFFLWIFPDGNTIGRKRKT